MQDLILATNNAHKVHEFKKIFTNVNILSLKDIGLKVDIEENASTFMGNSLIKCQTIYSITGKPVIADDSGLAVDQLNGAPGVFSARYGKPEFNDRQRYEFLLSNMDFSKPTGASFVCALTLMINPNRIFSIQEEVRGIITQTPSGTNGFGYDPIFYIEDFKKTYAELSDEEKNRISHRGKAAKVMQKIIADIF
jgi:XTP/dITP diphosphohydrolase